MPRSYRKTPKGQHEMACRSHRLSPRQRAALILVDGQRSAIDICRLLGPQASEWLIELAWQNLIEAVPPGEERQSSPSMPALGRPLLPYYRNAARRSQVSTTVSGFKEIEAIPSRASHSAKSA